MRSVFLLPAIVASLLWLAGCADPYHLHVRHQAAPDPFAGQRGFTVAPTIFTQDLRVGEKSESDYLSEKSDEQRAAWAEDKLALDAQFRAALASAAADYGVQTTAGDARFVLHPTIYAIEPGYNVGVSAGPCVINMTVQLTGTDGKLLDKIDVENAFSTGYTTHARMQSAASWVGKGVAHYLKIRTAAH